jgi:hypothetical protein
MHKAHHYAEKILRCSSLLVSVEFYLNSDHIFESRNPLNISCRNSPTFRNSNIPHNLCLHDWSLDFHQLVHS